MRKPPHGTLANAPRQVVACKQQRGDLAEGWLMTDHKDAFPRVGPAGRREDVGSARAGSKLLSCSELALERERGLLRAVRRTRQNARRVGQTTIEPIGDALRLLESLRSEAPAEVGFAGLGLGVAPEDEIHERALSYEST